MSTLKFHPPIGEPPAVQFFGVERLQVDHSYQRGTQGRRSRGLIETIAARWDWRLCTPLLVSSRDGGLFIIDGQHRWEAAKLRGDIPFLPCACGSYDGAAAEAALFVAANRHRVAVNRFDMWRAAIASGDEEVIAIERLVSEAGLAIATSPTTQNLRPGELLCTKGLIAGVRAHGEAKVAAALNSVGKTFGDQSITYAGVIFHTVLGFFTSPPADFDPNRFAEALAASSADEWATHPALAGAIGNSSRAKILRRLILEVMAMLEDEEEAAAA